MSTRPSKAPLLLLGLHQFLAGTIMKILNHAPRLANNEGSSIASISNGGRVRRTNVVSLQQKNYKNNSIAFGLIINFLIFIISCLIPTTFFYVFQTSSQAFGVAVSSILLISLVKDVSKKLFFIFFNIIFFPTMSMIVSPNHRTAITSMRLIVFCSLGS